MKQRILGTFALIAVAGLFAQGTVVFDNNVPGAVVTHVYLPDPGDSMLYVSGYGANDFPAGTSAWRGALVEGTDFVAQLWAAPVRNAPANSLYPASPITTFHTGAGAGFVVGMTATLAGI